jgi:hypothetical protein
MVSEYGNNLFHFIAQGELITLHRLVRIVGKLPVPLKITCIIKHLNCDIDINFRRSLKCNHHYHKSFIIPRKRILILMVTLFLV